MSKRFIPKEWQNELEAILDWRAYCEHKAMDVLQWKRNLVRNELCVTTDNSPQQREKDKFLYKYYEYNYDKADALITNLCK